MSTRLEDELSAGMRDASAGATLPPGVFTRAEQRHRRHVTLRRGGYTLAAVGLAGALAFTVAPTGATHPDAAAATSAAGVTSWEMAGAVQSLSTMPYGLRVDYTRTQRGKSWTDTMTGGFDPVQDRGFLNDGHGDRFLILGDDVYSTRTGWHRDGLDSWLGELAGLTAGKSYLTLSDVTAHPERLLDKLRALTTVTFDGVDTYRYTCHLAASADSRYAAHDVAGTITVDPVTHRVVRISESTSASGPDPSIADRDAIGFTTTVTFADFGAPVHVDTP